MIIRENSRFPSMPGYSMTNHVHLLLSPQAVGAISYMMQALGRRYERYFNRAYRRTGTLLEGRYRRRYQRESGSGMANVYICDAVYISWFGGISN
jgi:REP element-mobilizing transposase RayT